MNLHTLLQQRVEENNPIRIGVIGAGKFGTMFLSQARLTPGFQIAGIADLDPGRAKEACLRTGWSDNQLTYQTGSDAINDTHRAGKIAVMDDSEALIDADLDIILEIAGVPEA